MFVTTLSFNVYDMHSVLM